MVKPRQLELLAALKPNISINLPGFLNSVLHDIVVRLTKAKNPQAVVSHQGLIKLIIIHELDRQQIAWDNFVNLEAQEPEVNPNGTKIEPPRVNPLRRKRT